MTMRTNPVYRELAHQKAIVAELIDVLRTKYTPAFGDEPDQKIVCEDVFRDDSEVPQDSIEDFIGVLSKQEADLDLELNKFEFVKREGKDASVTSKKKKTSSRSRRPARRKTQAKRRPSNKARARKSG